MTLITDLIKQQQTADMEMCRDIVYALRDAGYEIPEKFRVLLEQKSKANTAQTATQVVDAVVGMCEGMKEKKYSVTNLVYAGRNHEVEAHMEIVHKAVLDNIITTLRAQVSEGDKK
jgi:hypothetical protein